MSKRQQQRIGWAIVGLSLTLVTVGCSGLRHTVKELIADTTNSSNPAKTALAEHLKSHQSKLYSTFWCPYCKQQKDLFGRGAAKQIMVIECDPNGQDAQPKLCLDAKVTSFPTWEINGQFYPGFRSLEELADLSGYQGSREFGG